LTVQELLFIPGKFDFHEKKVFSITKIYVSSKESVYNGKLNWGIPKKIGDFKRKKISENEEIISVKENKSKVMDIKLKTRGLPIPVNSKILPFASTLCQKYNDKFYYTHVDISGWMRYTTVSDISINQKYFPDISNIRPILAIKIDNLKLTFEKPEIKKK